VKMRVASGLLEMRSIGAPWSNSCNSSPVRILHTMPMSPLVAMTRSTPRERSSLQPACSSGWSYSITRSSTKLDAFHMCSVVPAVVAMRVLPRLKRALVTGLSCSKAVTAVPVNTFHNWTCCPAAVMTRVPLPFQATSIRSESSSIVLTTPHDSVSHKSTRRALAVRKRVPSAFHFASVALSVFSKVRSI